KSILRQVAAVNSPAPDSIALFADEPEPIPGGDQDTAPRYWTGAILRRYRFPGLRGPETVSGTCARKEGLRTLTSPRREASLFKLGRSLVCFGQFSLSSDFFVVRRPTVERPPQPPQSGVHRPASIAVAVRIAPIRVIGAIKPARVWTVGISRQDRRWRRRRRFGHLGPAQGLRSERRCREDRCGDSYGGNQSRWAQE